MSPYGPENAVLCEPVLHPNDKEQSNEWSASTLVPRDEPAFYRFFVCHVFGQGKDQLTVTRWESNLQPRSLILPSDTNNYKTDLAHFGNYANHERVDPGWLTGQTMIELRLHSKPLHIHHTPLGHYSVRCLPVDHLKDAVDECEDTSKSPPQLHHQVSVSKLSDPKSASTTQPGHGVTFDPDCDYLVFRMPSFQPQDIAYRLEIYDHPDHSGDASETLVGRSYVLPQNLHKSQGSVTVPVMGTTHSPIGHITVEYLVATPLTHQHTMEVSYAHHWLTKPTIHIGHRGLGSSFHSDSLTSVTENTVASLAQAGSHGAEYVEFDVQLSKDKIPVIYHDFHVCLNSNMKNGGAAELVKVPVKDLTFQQLSDMQLHHVSNTDLEGTSDDTQPFPTLKRCFDAVDEEIGFNIEIKYSMQDQNGVEECDNFFDMNEYVDILLADILTHAPPRRVVLSCFHPDICILLRLKQNKYPVMFLTSCANKSWDPYMDPRTRTMDYAIRLCQDNNLLGIVVESCVILADVTLVSKVKDAGLVLFCFGSDNNDLTVQKQLKSLGLDAIIHDGMETLKPEISATD